MQRSAPGAALALLLWLAPLRCGAGAGFLGPPGAAEREEWDATAIRRLEVVAVHEKGDSAALATVAQVEEKHAEVEEEEAKATTADSSALREKALRAYERRLVRARKELMGA